MSDRQRSMFGLGAGQQAGCTAVRVGHRIITGLIGPERADGSCDVDPQLQAQRCIEVLGGALAELGSGIDEVVRTYVWLRHPADASSVMRAHAAAFSEAKPALTLLVAGGFVDPRFAVQMEAEAVLGLPRERFSIDSYPARLFSEEVSWSQAIKVDDRVITSSIAPMWPDGSCDDPDPEAQLDRCIDVTRELLSVAGAKMEQVVRARTFLVHPADAAPTIRYRPRWPTMTPATTQLCLQRHYDPDWRVVFEAEADLREDRRKLMYFLDPTKSAAVGRCRGVKVGDRVFVGTTAPRWPDAAGVIPEGEGWVDPDPVAQTERCWEIVSGALEEAGASTQEVTHVRFYIRHPDDASIMHQLVRDVFGDAAPTVSIVAATYNRPQWRIELDAEAICG